MPTATSFTALGGGNGFQGCLRKVDVTLFDHWITLGGVSSGSASDKQIHESLKNCMKLYWNLSSANVIFTATWDLIIQDSTNISFDKGLPNHQYLIENKPKERLCNGVASVRSGTGMTEEELDETSGTGCGTSGNFKIIPVEMYNGPTNDISNFVGYGVQDLFRGSSGGNHPEGQTDCGVIVKVSSFLDGVTESGQVGPDPLGDTSVFYFDRTADILYLDGMPFRSFCEANASTTVDSIFEKTLTSSKSSASASAEVDFGPGNYSESVTSSVTIPSNFGFAFYTY